MAQNNCLMERRKRNDRNNKTRETKCLQSRRSTLLSRIWLLYVVSSVKQKVKESPFTVIVPNLGLPAEYRTLTSFIILGDLSFKKTSLILVISLSVCVVCRVHCPMRKKMKVSRSECKELLAKVRAETRYVPKMWAGTTKMADWTQTSCLQHVCIYM